MPIKIKVFPFKIIFSHNFCPEHFLVSRLVKVHRKIIVKATLMTSSRFLSLTESVLCGCFISEFNAIWGRKNFLTGLDCRLGGLTWVCWFAAGCLACTFSWRRLDCVWLGWVFRQVSCSATESRCHPWNKAWFFCV